MAPYCFSNKKGPQRKCLEGNEIAILPNNGLFLTPSLAFIQDRGPEPTQQISPENGSEDTSPRGKHGYQSFGFFIVTSLFNGEVFRGVVGGGTNLSRMPNPFPVADDAV